MPWFVKNRLTNSGGIMATVSNTYTFTASTSDIIAGALRILGVLAPGDTVSAADTTNLTFALNLIVKALAAEGILIWTYTSASVTLTTTTPSYNIGPSSSSFSNGPKPEKIVQAWIQDSSGNKTPLIIYDRNDFLLLTPRTSPGIPNSLYYDNQVSSGTTWTNLGIVNIWPVTNTTGYTLYVSFQRPIMDVVNPTDTFDVPTEFFLPLQWLLAKEVAMAKAVNLEKYKLIAQQADAYKNQMSDMWAREESISFAPDPMMAYRGL